MAALASPADVEDRLGRDLTAREALRVDALLVDASAAVRLYTGRSFDTGEATTRFRANRKVIRLPSKASAVDAVADVDGNDVPFTFDGIDRVEAWPEVYLDGFERDLPLIYPTVYDVTWTADASTVPDGIKGVVAQMVGRALGKTPDVTGLQQESVAGYSYTLGSAAAAGAVGMLPDERAVLDRFRRHAGVVWQR